MLLNPAEKDIYLKFSNINLPRHTSYPVVPVWEKGWNYFKYEPELISKMKEEEEISLYVHVPFCKKLCHYCACNKEIVSDDMRAKSDPASSYLMHIGLELKILSDTIGKKKIKQLHLGGGSPTFLKVSQLSLLLDQISTWFDTSDVGEMSVEVDPRVTTREQLIHLKGLGFNRISLGIQDFDSEVQKAIGRVQPFEMVKEFVSWIRELKFDSLNFDLIYGLPLQSIKTVKETVNKVLELSPDRIAYYRLALIPEIFKWQRSFARHEIPSAEDNLNFLQLAMDGFNADYDMIGFDHFSKKDEALSKAKKDGTIRRNFQGMTTERKLPILGVGPSAISDLHGVFSQNHKTIKKWSEALERGLLPVNSGMILSKEDVVRKSLMDDLYGLGKIDLNKYIERSRELGSDINFEPEMERVAELKKLGIVEVENNVVQLTFPLGQLLSRVCGAAFDPYLPNDAYLNGVSEFRVSKI